MAQTGYLSTAAPSPWNPRLQNVSNARQLNDDQWLASTFGVEFEMTLAFHEWELLRKVFPSYAIQAEIIKDPRLVDHRTLLGSWFGPRRRWPEWALLVKAGADATLDAGLLDLYSYAHEHMDGWVRTYFIEPLLIAKDALEGQQLHANVVGVQSQGDAPLTPFPGQNPDRVCLARATLDYSQWTLTNDPSLIGSTRRELYNNMSRWSDNEGVINDWDSHGVELRTPIFDGMTAAARSAACRGIHDYLSTIKHEKSLPLRLDPPYPPWREQATYRAYDSLWSGCHVHIGFGHAQPRDIPLPFLQHLVFILLTNEQLISTLHPKSRAGIERHNPQASPQQPPAYLHNLSEIQIELRAQQAEEDRVRRLTQSYTATEHIHSNRVDFIALVKTHPNPTLAQVSRYVFTPDITLRRLALFYGGRDSRYLVSLHNLFAWCQGQAVEKATIEFRQHGSTLDAAETHRWVEFLFALVRLAERKALEPTPAGYTYPEQAELAKYAGAATDAPAMCGSIAELCGEDFLGLSDEEAHYWTERQAHYALYDLPSDTIPISMDRVQRRTVGGTGRVTRSAARKSKREAAEAWRWAELQKFLNRAGKEGKKGRK